MTEKMDDQMMKKPAPGSKPCIHMLFVVTSPKLAQKAELMFEAGHVPLVYRSYGRGTASSEMMDTLGLSNVNKCVLICMLPKVFVDELLKKLRKQLRLGQVNTGAAFTVPISGTNGRTLKLIEQIEKEANGDRDDSVKRSEMKMEESAYALIMAIVDRGYSEADMEAARPKGATGGTVINSRRVGTEEAMHFWEISVQPERELVLILADRSEKKSIMKAIDESCGMRSEAHGVVMSLPVDSIVGLD